MASLLDRYDQMQSRPFGTNTALSDGNQNGVGGSAGSQYRRQEAAYGQALRILNRAARRGDARSAMAAIDVRNQANEAGYSPGGIRNRAEFNSGILGRIGSTQQANDDLGQANDMNRTRGMEAVGTVNPRATQGAGRGTPLSGGGILDRVNPPFAETQAETTLQPVAPVIPQNRTYAGLDVLEGLESNNANQFQQGINAATTLGVASPEDITIGDTNLRYRQTLDSALGQAQTPEQIAALRDRGSRFGVDNAAFDNRAKWWERNRRTNAR